MAGLVNMAGGSVGKLTKAIGGDPTRIGYDRDGNDLPRPAANLAPATVTPTQSAAAEAVTEADPSGAPRRRTRASNFLVDDESLGGA